MQIAIFGGSFDPVHIAHVAIVGEALKQLNVDKLIVVPTYLNPFKNNFYLEPCARFKLLTKVFQDFEKVEVCDFEINQQKLSYTIDTVNYLKDLYKPIKIYFILGDDNIKNLDKWYKIEELKNLVEFVVASRKGFESIEAAKFKRLSVNIDISSTNLRTNMDFKYIPTEIKKDIINLKKGKNF